MSIVFSFIIVFLMCSLAGDITQYIKLKPIISWQKKNKVNNRQFKYVSSNIIMDAIAVLFISVMAILYISSLPINALGYTVILTIVGMIGAVIFFVKINTNENTKPIMVLFNGFTNNCNAVIKNYSKYDSNPVIKDLISKIINSEKDIFFNISILKKAMETNELNHTEIEKNLQETHSQCYKYETALIKEIIQEDTNFSLTNSVYTQQN